MMSIFDEFLTSDASSLLLNTILGPIWGVFLNGVPVITPATQLDSTGQQIVGALDTIQAIASSIGAPNILPVSASTIDFEFAQENPISNYPQEQGAFQSYNKVTLPFDIKVAVACAGSDARRQAFISTVLAIEASLALYSIVTPERVFTSCNCHHVGWRRNALRGVTMIVADMWFERVNVVSGTDFLNSAAGSFLNTQSPAASGQQASGTVQTQSVADGSNVDQSLGSGFN
jgi:hypothetical protein